MSGLHQSLGSERINLERERALQVAGLILVNDTTLGKLVDLADHAGQFLSGCSEVGQCPEVANGIAGRLALIPIPSPALGYLTNIFLSSLMVCHVLSFLKFSDGKVNDH